MILDRHKAEGWGANVIDRLSQDLRNEFPGQQGFSPRNLKYCRPGALTRRIGLIKFPRRLDFKARDQEV
jgi:hypothetical protein